MIDGIASDTQAFNLVINCSFYWYFDLLCGSKWELSDNVVNEVLLSLGTLTFTLTMLDYPEFDNNLEGVFAILL